MNTKWFETFRRVAELRSYSRAADVLYLTQPAVSKHVENLERAFGQKLFNRSGRGIQVTEAGWKVYEVAVHVENDLCRLHDELAALNHSSAGLVHIAAGPTVLYHYIPRLLKRLWAEHPAITVRTSALVGEAITEAVLEGRASIGIQSVAHLDPTLAAVPCLTDRIVLVSSPDHPLAEVEFLTADDLRAVKIGMLGSSNVRRHIDEWLAGEGVILQEMVEFTASDAMRAAVLANLFVALLSERAVAEDLAAGRLRRLPIQGPEIPYHMYALYDRQPPSATACVVEMIQRAYVDPNFWA